MCRGVVAQTPEQPPVAERVGPIGRAFAVAVVVGFTWLAEAAFKALLKLF
jgi:hypothetical protein